MNRKIAGVVPAIGTPLADDEQLDEIGLRKLTRYVVKAGAHAILANGSMGGFAFLDNDTQIRAIETVVDEVNGAIPVIGGLGETGTRRAVAMARRIAATGVSHMSLLPPFYFSCTQEQLSGYFGDIAAAVSTNLFLYDAPGATKNKIHPETVARLRASIPHIVGIKVSDADCVALQRLINLMRDDGAFSILTGSEFLFHAALHMGCDGGVGGLYNLCPHIAVRLYEAFVAGDQGGAARYQRDLIDTWQLFQEGDIWGGFDEALRYLGLCESASGAPYRCRIGPEAARRVVEIMDRMVKPYLA